MQNKTTEPSEDELRNEHTGVRTELYDDESSAHADAAAMENLSARLPVGDMPRRLSCEAADQLDTVPTSCLVYAWTMARPRLLRLADGIDAMTWAVKFQQRPRRAASYCTSIFRAIFLKAFDTRMRRACLVDQAPAPILPVLLEGSVWSFAFRFGELVFASIRPSVQQIIRSPRRLNPAPSLVFNPNPHTLLVRVKLEAFGRWFTVRDSVGSCVVLIHLVFGSQSDPRSLRVRTPHLSLDGKEMNNKEGSMKSTIVSPIDNLSLTKPSIVSSDPPHLADACRTSLRWRLVLPRVSHRLLPPGMSGKLAMLNPHSVCVRHYVAKIHLSIARRVRSWVGFAPNWTCSGSTRDYDSHSSVGIRIRTRVSQAALSMSMDSRFAP
ncbi:hypothetical protein NMY22_g13901 [Coprinellus aureogranulatus]|nr:hypothetical protein NMY22_g13901 [Coprinellus aureogranulatus]